VKALMLLFAMTVAQAAAAALPPEFVGTWILAGSSNNQCRKADWTGPAGANDRLISISSTSVREFEGGCDIRTVKRIRTPFDGSNVDIEVEEACGGEGMTSRQSGVWHVQSIDGRKVLTTTVMRAWDQRGDNGRRMPTQAPFSPRTSVYLECQ
jgi:hypothetical protein